MQQSELRTGKRENGDKREERKGEERYGSGNEVERA